MLKKRTFLFCIILIFAFMASSTVYAKIAGGLDGHDKELEQVLFGESGVSDAQKEAAKALEAAAYLTIDQYKGDGSGKLEVLEKYGVPNLPSIEDIDISSSEWTHHREYTHKGWDSDYRDVKDKKPSNGEVWIKKWDKRKKILEDTVNEVFDMKWWGKIPILGSYLPDYGQQCDSFCALVYYVHILGDHEVTDSFEQYSYLMPVGGKLNQCDIIHELLYHCNVLFASQSNTYQFAMFKTKLNALNSEYANLGKVTAANIESNKEYAKKLVSILKDYVPSLLENETFFSDVFGLENAA